MKVDFWFALKQAAWAVGNLRNPHHNAPGGLDGTNGLGRFGAVVCDLGPILSFYFLDRRRASSSSAGFAALLEGTN